MLKLKNGWFVDRSYFFILYGYLLSTKHICSFTASMDSTAQTGHAGVIDWQEECYQKASGLSNCVLMIFFFPYCMTFHISLISSWLFVLG